jgi:hypothetical protein
LISQGQNRENSSFIIDGRSETTTTAHAYSGLINTQGKNAARAALKDQIGSGADDESHLSTKHGTHECNTAADCALQDDGTCPTD